MISLMPERPPGTFTEATRLNNAEEEFKWREDFFIVFIFFQPLKNITQYFYTSYYVFFFSNFPEIKYTNVFLFNRNRTS